MADPTECNWSLRTALADYLLVVGCRTQHHMEALIADRALQLVDVKRVGVDHDQRGIAAEPFENGTAEGSYTRAIFHEQAALAPVDRFEHAAHSETRRRDDRANHARMFDKSSEKYRPLFRKERQPVAQPPPQVDRKSIGIPIAPALSIAAVKRATSQMRRRIASSTPLA